MYRNFDLKSKVKIVGYEWKNDNTRYVVCLVHGIGEHAGRYDRTGEAFKEYGISMVGMDLRGHGISAGTRGHTSPRGKILGDIDLLIEYIQDEYPKVPVLLFGHSMGGNIALDYRRRGRYRNVPQGYIITSPWLILRRRIPKLLLEFARVMSKLKPDFTMKANIRTEQLGNTEIITRQANRHLVHDMISVTTALEGMEIAELLLGGRLETREDGPLRPMLLMQGGADMICDPEGSRKLAQLEKDLCTYIEWPGLYHEIHNGSPESDGTEAVRAMIDWIVGFGNGKDER